MDAQVQMQMQMQTRVQCPCQTCSLLRPPDGSGSGVRRGRLSWQRGRRLYRGRRCRPVWHRYMSSDESRRVTMEHAMQPVAVRGDNTTTRGRAAKSHRAGCVRRGAKKDTARQYTAFTARRNIRPHAHGVRLSRALSSALSLDAPNAQWPAASLVLAPILNLQGRSR